MRRASKFTISGLTGLSVIALAIADSAVAAVGDAIGFSPLTWVLAFLVAVSVAVGADLATRRETAEPVLPLHSVRSTKPAIHMIDSEFEGEHIAVRNFDTAFKGVRSKFHVDDADLG
jgi:hypothetical protein